MSLDDSYLRYAKRQYGMDHDLYDWSMLTDRSPVVWPDQRPLALWINVSLQYFPLDQRAQPFAPPGGMVTAYPDLRHYTLRDYGNRVGIYRVFKALDRYNVSASVALNTRLAERVPYLLERVVERGHEVLCHGWDMDTLHYGGLDPKRERDIVAKSLETLRAASDQAVVGWISPAKSQSPITPQLLVEHGVEFMCDWVNDDLPYEFRTPAGSITALPQSIELEDRFVIADNGHSESEWAQQIVDACDFLIDEAQTTGAGRLLALNLHPWMIGQPHRIGALERVLEHVMGTGKAWSAGPQEIIKVWRSCQTDPDA